MRAVWARRHAGVLALALTAATVSPAFTGGRAHAREIPQGSDLAYRATIATIAFDGPPEAPVIAAALPAAAEPAPEPEPGPPPATRRRSGVLSADELDAVLAEAGWPSDLWPAAASVVYCESRNQPGARNGSFLGLFQLSTGWFAYAGVDLSSWDDPVANAQAAYAVYLYDVARGARPWAQWSCKP